MALQWGVPVPKGEDNDKYKVLVIAWAMAIRFGMEDCANTIVESIKGHLNGFQEQGKLPIGSKILFLTRKLRLPSDSPCRTFFMDRFAWEMDNLHQLHLTNDTKALLPGYEEIWEKGGSLVRDIMTAWYQRRAAIPIAASSKDPASDDTCLYHIHENDSVCHAMAGNSGVVMKKIVTSAELRTDATLSAGILNGAKQLAGGTWDNSDYPRKERYRW